VISPRDECSAAPIQITIGEQIVNNMDDAYRQQIERARRMTPDERFREGLALCDRTFRLMSDGIRHQFPQASPEEVLKILRERLAIIRRIEAKR
jgi:hypothetical protein